MDLAFLGTPVEQLKLVGSAVTAVIIVVFLAINVGPVFAGIFALWEIVIGVIYIGNKKRRQSYGTLIGETQIKEYKNRWGSKPVPAYENNARKPSSAQLPRGGIWENMWDQLIVVPMWANYGAAISARKEEMQTWAASHNAHYEPASLTVLTGDDAVRLLDATELAWEIRNYTTLPSLTSGADVTVCDYHQLANKGGGITVNTYMFARTPKAVNLSGWVRFKSTRRDKQPSCEGKDGKRILDALSATVSVTDQYRQFAPIDIMVGEGRVAVMYHNRWMTPTDITVIAKLLADTVNAL